MKIWGLFIITIINGVEQKTLFAWWLLKPQLATLTAATTGASFKLANPGTISEVARLLESGAEAVGPVDFVLETLTEGVL
jgi:hypothetical protein